MEKKPQLSGRVLVVAHSDQHVGSDIGLCPPKWSIQTENGDTREYTPNSAQRPLCAHWEAAWGRMFVKGLPIVAVNNGDNIQGNDGKFFGLWSHNLQEQSDVAIQVFKPKRNGCVRWYSTRGTPRHVGGMGQWDEYIAKELGSDTEWGTFSAYHLELEVSGVLFDIAHHGLAVGRYQHTYENQARSFAKNVCAVKLSRRERPPDVIISSHVHSKLYEVVTVYDHKCHVIITPAFMMKGEFAHRVVRQSDLSDIGLAYIEVENGKVLDVDFDLMEVQTTRKVTA